MEFWLEIFQVGGTVQTKVVLWVFLKAALLVASSVSSKVVNWVAEMVS